VAVAALLLSGCGGETYPIAAGPAYQTLSEVGTPAALEELPGGLEPVSVNFEALPGDNSVQWLFTHDGEDLARIVASVTPDGDAASVVSLRYMDGTAPDENWRNGQARGWIRNGVFRLVEEAIDARMENRSFDQAVSKEVRHEITLASVGSMMKDVDSSLDAHIAKQEQSKKEAEAMREANSYTRTRPTTDLSKYSGNRS
jgi:hypothetical protein